MASKEMIERAAKAVKNEFSKVVGEFGLTRAKEIVPSNHRYIRAALNAARPAPEAEDMVGCEWCVDGLQADGETPCPCQEADLPRQVRDFKRAIAERDEQIERLNWKIDGLRTDYQSQSSAADEWRLRALSLEVHLKGAEARASELQREVERLRKAIDDALGRHQVTHIHAGLRAALQQEGDSDGV